MALEIHFDAVDSTPIDSATVMVLRDGAQVDLTENQLTLAIADRTLVYKLADLVN